MTFRDKITVRLPKSLKRELSRQAKARMLQPSDLAREALSDYLKSRMPAPVVVSDPIIPDGKEVAAFADPRLLWLIVGLVMAGTAVFLCILNWHRSHENIEIVFAVSVMACVAWAMWSMRKTLFIFLIAALAYCPTLRAQETQPPPPPQAAPVICGILIIGAGVVIYIELDKWCKYIQPVAATAPPSPPTNCPACTSTNCPGPNCPTNHPAKHKASVVNVSSLLAGDNVTAVTITNRGPTFTASDGSAFCMYFSANISGGESAAAMAPLCTVQGWISPTCVLTVTSTNGVMVSRDESYRAFGTEFQQVVPFEFWDASRPVGMFSITP